MRYVEIEGKEYEVTEKATMGKAKVVKGKVYIYFGKQEIDKPGLYLVESKAKIKAYPKDKEILESDIYEKEETPDNKFDLFAQIKKDKDKIIKTSKKPVLSKEEKDDIFAPSVSEDDNQFVRIIKNILKEKQINIKIIAHKFKDQMEMNNYKRSLRIHNKMSIERFEKWMEVLDYDWTVECKEKK